MDKSKLIAIAVLVLGIGCIAFFKASEDAGTASPGGSSAETQSTPDFDVAGGVKELKVEDERKGTGTVAKAGNSVTVNYRGILLNGKQFDESYSKGPFSFQLGGGQVIKGWDLGIGGDKTKNIPPMRVGGKRKLTIPAELGYGDRGAGADIPPGATLKFDVELLKVNGKG